MTDFLIWILQHCGGFIVFLGCVLFVIAFLVIILVGSWIPADIDPLGPQADRKMAEYLKKLQNPRYDEDGDD